MNKLWTYKLFSSLASVIIYLVSFLISTNIKLQSNNPIVDNYYGSPKTHIPCMYIRSDTKQFMNLVNQTLTGSLLSRCKYSINQKETRNWINLKTILVIFIGKNSNHHTDFRFARFVVNIYFCRSVSTYIKFHCSNC